MQFLSAILLGAASLAVAAPLTDAEQNTAQLNKRISDSSNCGLDMYQTATEARVANIIDDFTSTCHDGSQECKTTTFTAAAGQQGKVIACIGNTGVFLSVDKDPAGTHFNVPFSAGDLGTQLLNTYSDCYGAPPSSKAGDRGFIRAFQYWGQGYNLLVTGNVDCGKNGF